MYSPFTCTNPTRWLLLLTCLLAAPSLYAISFKGLLMPGNVITGHAEYEEQCEKCHDDFDKDRQSQLCLDCHDDIAADITGRRGYHGLSPEIKPEMMEVECKSCHTDHRGRGATIVHLDRARFNHNQSDFKLEGAHTTTACTLCHKDQEPYRKAPSSCHSCHKRDDIHQGKMGKKCKSCHQTNAWIDAKFDHDKTQFKLEGAHRQVRCNICHPNQRYKEIPTTCYACHQSNDRHSKVLGTQCNDCHSNDKWKTIHFNHDKDTEFRLKGIHRKLSCTRCHQQPVKQEKRAGRLGKSCYACHRLDDLHNGRNGRDCASCHNNQRWGDTRFDHDKDTKFALQGGHKEQPCHACHRGDPTKEKLKQHCDSCHDKEDIHEGKLGKQCNQCHNSVGWSQEIRFDHDLGAFPLTGQHTITTCEACHFDAGYRETEHDCIDCHKDADNHEGVMGEQCDVCHNPNDWALWHFDHDLQTGYPLTGSHKELRCSACHTDPVANHSSDNPRSCNECHKRDDIHQGDFGRNCDRCHVTTQFKELSFGRGIERR